MQIEALNMQHAMNKEKGAPFFRSSAFIAMNVECIRFSILVESNAGSVVQVSSENDQIKSKRYIDRAFENKFTRAVLSPG